MFNKLLDNFAKYKIKITVITLLILFFIVYTIASRNLEPAESLSFSMLIVAGLAAIIACIAVILAKESLDATNKALELTRTSIRPLLYTSGSIKVKRVEKYITLQFDILNSGSLPGENVNAYIDFFEDSEEVTEDNLSNRYTQTTRESEFSLLFPNSIYHEIYILDLEEKNDLELWNSIKEGKTKYRIRIIYNSLGRRHLTIKTENIVKPEWEDKLLTTSILPQKWE